MNKSLVLISYLLLNFAIPFGQTKQDKLFAKSLDQFLSTKFKPTEPGCAVLIAKKGTVIYKKAFGSASIELNTAVQPNMVFNIGSITKQFTAVAILQLVEQGKLSLQDSLQKYVKTFPSKGHIITIENLLTHTSGIKDYLQIDYGQPFMERWDFSPVAIIDSFKNQPLEFEPGTKFQYSNSGYFLLGYIIETITGKTWQEYLKQNIFLPLGLAHTYTDSPAEIIPRRVYGYMNNTGHFEKADYWSATLPYSAGAIISNVEDLYNWHKGLYQYKILKKETLDKAFTPFKLKNGLSTGYGYGWFVKNSNNFSSIEHAGGMVGFVSNEIYYPDEDVFIALLFNSGNAPKDDLSVRISEWALGRSLQPDIKIDESILSKYTGTYLFTLDSNRTIIIKEYQESLIAEISGQGTLPLIFESETKFQFKGVLDAKAEFIKEDDRVIKFIINQNGMYEWIKRK
ncbi:MAG: serine hydrolase domain-containing protein [Ferruginibacter sp.]